MVVAGMAAAMVAVEEVMATAAAEAAEECGGGVRGDWMAHRCVGLMAQVKGGSKANRRRKVWSRVLKVNCSPMAR
jgi:hypothetical protein